VEESEFKATYSNIARIPCAFEKALTNNKARCSHSRHFWLADREGYACDASELSDKCCELLVKLRENSRFTLKLQQTGEKLPHNMEIRVQAGGLNGIASLFSAEQQDVIEDIHALLARAQAEYGGLESWPYDRIVQSISSYQGRKSRKRS
jgi:hypothetical protein